MRRGFWIIGLLGTLLSCSSFRGPPDLDSSLSEGLRTPPPLTPRGGSRRKSVVDVSPIDANTYEIKKELQFAWPIEEARLSRGFVFSGRKKHWGLDLANKKGTAVFASEDGVVIYTGRGFRGYGKLIVIEHGPEWATLYSHLNKIEVEEGQLIRQGQKIGTMGRTGRATGVHLHFEIRKNRQPVNPLAYLPSGEKRLQ